jgi:DNA-directed RNA polymerase specialized sigma24 family protein
MASRGSVTLWIAQLKAGDREAVQPIWNAYFRRLIGLARKKLRNARRAALDEEDVALSAFDSFCRGAELGRFPNLGDRHDLWPLLIKITERKAYDAALHERRRKRGAGKLRGESAVLVSPTAQSNALGLDGVEGHEPSPEFAAQVAEEFQRLLDILGDVELRNVAIWKMEGHTNIEIAAKLGRVPDTVTRKLKVIRAIWSNRDGG